MQADFIDHHPLVTGFICALVFSIVAHILFPSGKTGVQEMPSSETMIITVYDLDGTERQQLKGPDDEMEVSVNGNTCRVTLDGYENIFNDATVNIAYMESTEARPPAQPHRPGLMYILAFGGTVYFLWEVVKNRTAVSEGQLCLPEASDQT